MMFDLLFATYVTVGTIAGLWAVVNEAHRHDHTTTLAVLGRVTAAMLLWPLAALLIVYATLTRR